MHLQSLDGKWDFRQLPGEEWLPAQVPGSVHLDLLKLGRIPDPYFGDNEKKVQWVAEKDWEYRRTFTVDADILREERVYLACEGLDTLAEVFVNGQQVGNVDNYFRLYEWEIRSLLKTGANQIAVRFCSPVKYVTQKQEELFLGGSTEAIEGYSYLRKPACHFGWDWGPKLPPVGIWKTIQLAGRSTGRIKHIHLRQTHANQKVTVSAELSTESWNGNSQMAKVTVIAPDQKIYAASQKITSSKQVLEVEIDLPQLWWPNGYGDHPLYQVDIILESGGKEIDRVSRHIGLRKVELVQEKDAWGRSFQFKINGQPIFVKGSNWIPADSFPTRVSDEKIASLIWSAVETHQNMLRVWGGGSYETDAFYAACDRNGILIWQDFMFACAVYPLTDPAFEENVREEVIQAIERLHSHPCLAIWCGNNEMEWGWNSWGWDVPGRVPQKQAYDRFFHHILPDLCTSEDPDTPYWASSPSSDDPFNNPNGEYQGDTHYWDVWHGRKPFSAYKDSNPRFMSEFGFQSLPPLGTIQTYADPADWNMTSYIMEHHQRSRSGNGLMISQMTEHYRMPKDFSSLVYLSMVLQAEGIRFGVEHWRRNKNRVSGTIYWQLNDIWPVASWSSVDYFGRWKALHYAARRFYAPVMMSIDQEGTRLSVHVTSDLFHSWDGSIH